MSRGSGLSFVAGIFGRSPPGATRHAFCSRPTTAPHRTTADLSRAPPGKRRRACASASKSISTPPLPYARAQMTAAGWRRQALRGQGKPAVPAAKTSVPSPVIASGESQPRSAAPARAQLDSHGGGGLKIRTFGFPRARSQAHTMVDGEFRVSVEKAAPNRFPKVVALALLAPTCSKAARGWRDAFFG